MMFGLFKSNPLKKLRKQYDTALQDAMQAQRHGDIRLYAELSTEADKIYQKIKRLEEGNAKAMGQ
tara:strand:- start:1122 stop:1316 length:195 start_codon:yes stop_codon:yes gene_type:complete